MTNESYLHQLTSWWKEHKDTITLSITIIVASCKAYLEKHEEVLKGVWIGLGLANDLGTLRRLRAALKENDAKRAAWCSFLLGLALANYLRTIRDLLDGGDDDGWQESDNNPLPQEPDGGLSKKKIRQLMESFLYDSSTLEPSHPLVLHDSITGQERENG